MPFLASVSTALVCGTHAQKHMCRQNSHTYKVKINHLLKKKRNLQYVQSQVPFINYIIKYTY